MDLEAKYELFTAKNFSNLDHDWNKFPGLPYTFSFEYRLMDQLESIRGYVNEHFYVPIILSILYCVGIFRLQEWMVNRERFGLRLPLIFWNSSLAIFSIFGSIRILPELFWMLRHKGLFASTCDSRFIDDGRYFLWLYLFTFSKVAEFGDTLFIILRKQKLLTLHWIHHALTLVYSWFAMIGLHAQSRWLCSMNFFIHSIMYSYYAIMASGFRVPRSTAQLITILQIAQMTFGLYTHGQSLVLPSSQCDIPFGIGSFGFIMYFIYWILFIKFFIDKYYRSGKMAIRSDKKRE